MFDLAQLPKRDLSAYKKNTSAYLPYIRLMSSKTKQCASLENPFPVNHFALFKSAKPDDLGDTFDLVVIAVRDKAVVFGDKATATSYDIESAVFKQAIATVGQGAMWGPEFLVWVPAEKTFATLHCGNPTNRNIAPALIDRCYINVDRKEEPLCTLGRKAVKYKNGNDGVAIVVEDCDATYDTYPTDEEGTTEVNKFMNPPVAEEAVAAGPVER